MLRIAEAPSAANSASTSHHGLPSDAAVAGIAMGVGVAISVFVCLLLQLYRRLRQLRRSTVNRKHRQQVDPFIADLPRTVITDDQEHSDLPLEASQIPHGGAPPPSTRPLHRKAIPQHVPLHSGEPAPK